MTWRVAGSLERLFEEVNAHAPSRSKAADGGIGDAAHASRASDHNPYIKDSRGVGVVRARDFTHDPKNGFDSYRFARTLILAPDERIRYVISNGEIWNPSVVNKWRPYSGKNPHDHHAHVSVVERPQSLYDDKSDWKWEAKPVDMAGDRPIKPVPDDPVLRRGSKGEAVRELQNLLGIKVDGDFGPATERAVKAFQTSRGLGSDGIAGFYTWKALRAAKAVAPKQPAVALVSSLQQIREYVFSDEGRELTVHSDEPGGASRLGISIDTLSRTIGRRATQDDLRKMTEDEAWSIYDRDFWDRIKADDLKPGINYAAFDFAVNSGPAVVDGDPDNNPKIVEDFLTRALREPNVEKQIDRLCDLRLEYMQSNKQKWERYRRGWLARVSRVRSRAHAMAGGE